MAIVSSTKKLTCLFYQLQKKSRQNLAITDISLGNQILEKGKVVEVVTSVKNLSKNTIKNKLVHLFLNGRRLGQDVINLEPQSTANLKFKIVPYDSGFQSGYVLLEDDALLDDLTINLPNVKSLILKKLITNIRKNK